jgi:hypothetical protein
MAVENEMALAFRGRPMIGTKSEQEQRLGFAAAPVLCG